MTEPQGSDRRLRIALAWALSGLLIVGYALLPGSDREAANEPAAQTAPEDLGRLDIVAIAPPAATPGSAVSISYIGAEPGPKIRVYMGKRELAVLAAQPGSVVARLPSDTEQKRAKIRIAQGDERSKPYDVQIDAPGWQKPFRNLVGGLALLLLGIGSFARGAREAVGLDAAARLARVARRGTAALGLGAIAGAFLQSTTATAGLLVGLVNSNLLAIGPAAAAFLGAGVGATTMPLLTGIIAPREGLLVVAIGVLLRALAPDRRFAAVARLVLGAGFVAFGLYLLRQGFDPFVSSPALLPIADGLHANSVGGVVLCALLGAALVAALQSPAPVIVLVLGFAQTTGHWDLHTAIAVLSGSGLGTALGGVLTMPSSPRARRLVELNVLIGALSTLIAACSAGLWAKVADSLVAGAPQEVEWGKRVLLPNLGLHLGVALALSELAIVIILLPAIPMLSRLLERVFPRTAAGALPQVGDAAGVARSGLLGVLRRLTKSLHSIEVLALAGRRDAGRGAEHELSDARSALDALLSGPVGTLEATAEGAELSAALFATRQLARSLDDVLSQAEQLLDGRIQQSSKSGSVALEPPDEQTLRDMQELLSASLLAVTECLEARAPLDVEAARSREIRMNSLEARARRALLSDSRARPLGPERLRVLELADAYEAAGNQAYRLAETIGGALVLGVRPSSPPPREAAGA